MPSPGGRFIGGGNDFLSRFETVDSPYVAGSTEPQILSGADLFGRIESDPNYYPERTDREILRANRRLIARLIKGKSVLELGPGNGNKTRYFLEQVDAERIINGYAAVDWASRFLSMTADKIRDLFPVSRTKTLESDFCACSREVVLPGEDTGLAMMSFGTTFGNFTPEGAVECLENLRRKVLKPGEMAFFSLDSTQEDSMIQPGYGNNITAQFFLNGLVYACQLAGLAGLNPDAFSYTASFNPESKFVEMNLVSAERQVLRCSLGSITIEKGEAIRVGQSRKLSEDGWEEIFTKSGYEIVSCLPDLSRKSRYNVWAVQAGPGG